MDIWIDVALLLAWTVVCFYAGAIWDHMKNTQPDKEGTR